MNGKYSYIIITPVYNEEIYIEKTIESVVNQSILPIQWIIIDDNSTDGTSDIIKKSTKQYRWIRYVINEKMGIKEKGPRIASLVNNFISDDLNCEFIAKLDADIILDLDFYEKLILEFTKNKKLGIGSGTLIYNNKKEKNIYPDLTRGATKFYRLKCFVEIGKLPITTGWDTLDNIIAQEKKWETKIFPIYFHHLKEEGSSQGYFRKYYNVGKYCGKIPYHTIYFILKMIYNIFNKPIILSSVYLLMGYAKTRYITRERPFPKKVSNYFRKKQLFYIKNIIKSKVGY